jgi:hypothetical protein
LNLFDKGIDSISLLRSTKSEITDYCKVICEELNTFVSNAKTYINATIYDVSLHDPLNMVVLNFESSKSEIKIKPFESLRYKLKEIDRYLLSQKAGYSIFVQKQIRHYESNKIYLIKPNQKRFWTRSQALEDSSSIIVEILSMEGNQ